MRVVFFLATIVCLTACGKSPTPVSTTVQTGPHQVLVTVFNSGTQDAAFGTRYHMVVDMMTSIPSTIVRTQGTTLQNGRGVGVDFSGLQCYYDANTQTQNVFTFEACSNGGVPGDKLKYAQGDMVSVWSYNHVVSNDSVVELVLEGETE